MEPDPISEGIRWLPADERRACSDADARWPFATVTEEAGNAVIAALLSPLAKGGGYNNAIHYTHGSTLRSFQEIFRVGPPAQPLLRDAANATDLSDLFTTFP